MMPMYMNSSQQHPQGHCCQGFGNYPTDASSSHLTCEHWPTPPPCYGNCSHGNYPVYSPYWSPCYPPQVPFHSCCGGHPGLRPHAPPYYIHQPFPVGYHQPGNESGKDLPGVNRCTKCSPQVRYPKNERGVVIEEHEPEIEKVNQGEAAHPVHSKNRSYPVIWIPHENGRSQGDGSCLVKGSHDQPPMKVIAPENMTIQKRDPKSWSSILPLDENTIRSLLQNQDRKIIQDGKNVGLPFDISKLRSLLQGHDGKEPQIQKGEEEQGQLPYPIFWIPSHEKREDAKASENRELNNGGSLLSSVPSGQHVNEGQIAQRRGGEANLESKATPDVVEKSSTRDISVQNLLQEPRNIPVKLSENHPPKPMEQPKKIAEKEPTRNTKKEESSSSSKASRLPPVCLRVDPLPKKRNACSKSLSPPRRKEQPSKSEETKVTSPLSSKKETRNAPEAESTVKREEANREEKISEARLNAAETGKESVENDSSMQDGAVCEIVKPSEFEKSKEKPAMTEEDAARIIQSAYRGYDVRRWEPIKKLKEIAGVREQMGDIKRRIKALKVSTGEEKEVVMLGEMVMSLLLKLDSVQGLHPSIRDHRKSLARELSDIQDELDSLKKSNAEEEAVGEPVEITSQTSPCPLNLELNQLAEESRIVSESNAEEVLPPSSDDHYKSIMNTTDGQEVAEAEENPGLSETLVMDPESATETGIIEADSMSVPNENKMVSESDADTVLSSPCEDQHISLLNQTDEQPVAGGEGKPGLPATLETDPVPATQTDIIEADLTRLPEENKMVSELNTEEVLSPSSEEHHKSPTNSTEGQQVAEGEEETEVSETLVKDTVSAPETRISESEKIVAVDAVLPVGQSPADGDETTGTNNEDDEVVEAMLEEPTYKLPQVVEETPELGFDASEDGTEVSLTEVDTSENETGKGGDDTVLPPAKDFELSELLPVEVINDEMQLSSQDSRSLTHEAETAAMDDQTERKEENVDYSSDNSKCIGLQETPEQQEKIEVDEKSEETKKLMEENQRYKEMVETLLKAGREQLEAISSLTGRVQSLEKKLSQRKKRTPIGRRNLPNRVKQSKPTSDAVM